MNYLLTIHKLRWEGFALLKDEMVIANQKLTTFGNKETYWKTTNTVDSILKKEIGPN